MYSPETSARIAELRSKSVTGTLTLEDCQEAVRLMRAGRMNAAAASAASKRKKAKKEVKSADQLLGELEGL